MGQLADSINLQTLEYLFKDRTLDPYMCGIRIAQLSNSIKIYRTNPILINVPGKGMSNEGELLIDNTNENTVTITIGSISEEDVSTYGFNPFKECYIDDSLPLLGIIDGEINKLDVITCRYLENIEILDYSDVTDKTNNFTILENFKLRGKAKLDILDLRHIEINHLYLIGSESYINKLYYRHNNKFLLFLNFKNSIIYSEGLTDGFISSLPTFSSSNQCILYNVSDTPAKSEWVTDLANNKNIILKDVIL